MIRFNCDYSEGAHPRILEKLQQTNLTQTSGYGQDEYCQEAAALIRQACRAPQADVHFLVGGTQTNLTVIAAALRPYQGVIASDTGHISLHETGAIEATGHKVITLPNTDGKITAGQVKAFCAAHFEEDMPEYMVQPKMVYISHPTEFGTLYTKRELEALRQACDQYNLYLFADGARLGYGLAAEGTDVTLADMARLCDVFYIGGTKVGALFGEAAVIVNDALKKDFRYMIKQTGAMLAKGRLLGLQFAELFRDDLYLQISKHADDMARIIKDALQKAGLRLLYDTPTNQLFFALDKDTLHALEKEYAFSHFGKTEDGLTLTRVCTSWATREEDARALAAALLQTAR